MTVENSLLQLTRGYVWMTSGSMFIKLLAFLNINLVLWNLTAYQFGAVELALSFIAVPSLLLFGGLSSTIIADVAAHRSRNEPALARTVFARFFVLSLSGGIAACIGVVLFAEYWGSFEGKEEVGAFLKVAALTLLVSPLRMAVQNMFTAFNEFTLLSVFSVIEEVAKTIGILVFVIYLERASLGLISAIVLSQAVPVFVLFNKAYTLFKSLGASHGESMNPFLLLRDHRLWSLANSTLGVVAKPMRVWLIKFFLGTEAVGLFAFAFGILGHVSSLVSISQVFAPLAARHAHTPDQFKRLVHAATKYQLLLSIGAALACIPLVVFGVPILYPNFTSAMPIVYGVLAALIPTGILALCTPIFIALREQRSQFMSAILRIVFLAVFAVILYPLFGIVGIGIELFATLLASLWERNMRLRMLVGAGLFNTHSLAHYTPEDAVLVSAVHRKIRTFIAQTLRK